MSKINCLQKTIGRLIIGRIPSTQLDDQSADALASGIMGGVVLFKENARDLTQLVSLTKSICAQSTETPIIASDQEGGAVQRFDHILTSIPSPMALAAEGDQTLRLKRLQALTQLSASQLTKIGINCLFAPVLDLCSNPLNPIVATRSFGSAPQLVKELGIAQIKALHDYPIMAVGKHFPGHGNTLQDSHTHLAIDDRDAKDIWQTELIPFRGAIEYLPAIMTGHIWLKQVDQVALPASLSERITTAMLRNYLGFKGLVFTDDLTMQAITSTYSLEEAAIMALLAGADQLLILASPDEVRSVHQALVKAVDKGRISEKQILDSAKRLEKSLQVLKSKQTSQPTLSTEETIKEIEDSLPKEYELALEAAQAGVCLIRGKVPDLSKGSWVVIGPKHDRYELNLLQELQHELAWGRESTQLTQVSYPLNPNQEDIPPLIELTKGKNCVFLTFRALLHKGQFELAEALQQVCNQSVIVALDVPYDVIGLSNWDNCLATLDPSSLAIKALAKVLVRKIEPKGTSPVNLQFAV